MLTKDIYHISCLYLPERLVPFSSNIPPVCGKHVSSEHTDIFQITYVRQINQVLQSESLYCVTGSWPTSRTSIKINRFPKFLGSLITAPLTCS